MSRAVLVALWIGGGALCFFGDGGTCLAPFVLLAGTSLVLGYTRGRSLAGVDGEGEKGSLTIEGDTVEVSVGGRVRARFRRSDVVSGWTEPGSWGGCDSVVLVTRAGVEVCVALADREQGAAILLAAGVAPEQRAVKIHVRPGGSGGARTLRIFFSILTTLVLAGLLALTTYLYLRSYEVGRDTRSYIVSELISLISCAGAGVTLWRLVRGLLTTTLTIGADGVVVQRFGSRRIVRRADLEGATVEIGELVLRQKGLAPVRIRASLGAAMAAVERIQAALQASRPDGVRIEGLDRAGRSTTAWLGDLRALGAQSRGYRTASVDRADLVAAVKDGAAPAERRIAAAVALAAGNDDEARAALRIAVDTCVDDRLRDALEQTAAGEMEAEALDEIAPRARARRT